MAYEEDVREFMIQYGIPADCDRDDDGALDVYYRKEPYFNVYGWKDHRSLESKQQKRCSWVIPSGTPLKEANVSQFTGTFTEDTSQMLMYAYPCHCSCGHLNDVVLAYEGTLGDILQKVLGVSDAVMIL